MATDMETIQEKVLRERITKAIKGEPFTKVLKVLSSIAQENARCESRVAAVTWRRTSQELDQMRFWIESCCN